MRQVFRNESIVAFFPDKPATLGHTLIVPSCHVPDIWSLDSVTAQALTTATLVVAHASREALSPDGLNVIQSNGEAATQSVFHLHVHVVPRSTGDTMGKIWPEETSWTEEEIEAAYHAIHLYLPGAQS